MEKELLKEIKSELNLKDKIIIKLAEKTIIRTLNIYRIRLINSLIK